MGALNRENITLQRKILAYLAIIRFPATIITAGLVGLLAIYHAIGPLDIFEVMFASLAYFLLYGAGFVINDYFDADIDKINKPNRPLPAGLISPREAILLYILMLVGSIIASIFVNQVFAILATLSSIILAVYSVYFKRYRGLEGNILMGIYAALVVLSGHSVLSELTNEIVIYTIPLFLYMVGTQIIMGIEDIKGDGLHGARTLPVVIGIKKSMIFALSLMLLALLLLLGTIKNLNEIIPVASIVLIYLYLCFCLITSPTPTIAKKFRKYMALSMILIVVIIVLRGR